MSWIIAGRTRTAGGIVFELHGSKTDESGRPLNVAVIEVPLEKDDQAPEQPPAPDTPIDPAVMVKAEKTALAEAVKQVGPGDTPGPGKPSRLAAAREVASRPAVTHTGAAAAGAVLVHLLTLVL